MFVLECRRAKIGKKAHNEFEVNQYDG